jgi:hypothetical protein
MMNLIYILYLNAHKVANSVLSLLKLTWSGHDLARSRLALGRNEYPVLR